MNKVKKNYIIYSASQVILLLFPLIVFPYASRVLGVDNFGLYDYSFTILTYFLIFAKLGIMNYGAREIAENTKTKLSIGATFKKVYTVQFLLTTLILMLYILFCIIFCQDKLIFSLLYCIFIIANYFDIAWFFQGVQDFNSISTRNLLINLIQMPSIFLFVHSKDDLLIYVIVMSLAQVFGNSLVWFKLKKYFSFKSIINVKTGDLKKIFIGMLILFIPILANNIYSLMDELMLGKLSIMGQVGLYACAKKIMYIPLAFITPLSMAMLPYISEAKSQGKKIEKKDKEKALLFTIWLSAACFVGMYYIAPDIIKIFFSKEYTGSIIIIQIMSFYSFFYVIAVLLRDVYFLPNHKDKWFVGTVIAGILINLLLNIILIPKFGAVGASIATVISELFILIIRIVLMRNEINWKIVTKESLYYIICSFIMYFISNLLNLKTNLPIINLIIKVLVCIIIYVALTGPKVLRLIKTQETK